MLLWSSRRDQNIIADRRVATIFTDHLRGPGRAIGPLCAWVCVSQLFELDR